jgi:ABC-2 type transport system ATP-binding protein
MRIKNLTKTIEGQSILKSIDFQLFDNEIVGLVGRNGSGKTSLFRVIASHYLPDNGEILINQKSVYQYPEVKQEIFLLTKKKTFYRPTP